MTNAYPLIKRILDATGATVLLVLLAPVLLGIGACIWLRSGRPLLFRQIRVGRRGQRFHIIKFRTLHTGSHNPLNPAAHTTPVGRLLRRYALDELPQLWNVLCGEMSFIGPRPVLPAEANGYGPRERGRLRVRPGLTGWAQVNGRNALPWRERIERDLWYVAHRSLTLDLRILLKTPGALLAGKGVYGPGNRDPNAEEVAAHRTGNSKFEIRNSKPGTPNA